jgi:hypothetical protein
MPDSQNAKNVHDTHVKASTRHTKSGKVVSVQSFDRHFDAMGETLKEQARNIPMVATPGKFPLGRSTPGSPKVQKAEAARQDAELAAALKEVEQLKAQLTAMNAPPPHEKKSPTQPTYSPQYSYGDGVGEFAGPASVPQ